MWGVDCILLPEVGSEFRASLSTSFLWGYFSSWSICVTMSCGFLIIIFLVEVDIMPCDLVDFGGIQRRWM